MHDTPMIDRPTVSASHCKDRPIRMIVPFPPGGNSKALAASRVYYGELLRSIGMKQEG
jgi:tripartite-type tricarboxylate transporter receptor subunit TctC